MRTNKWKKVNSILHNILDLSHQERKTYLDNLEIEEEIKKEVEELLSFEGDLESWSFSNALDLIKDSFEQETHADNLNGQRIGVYEIKKEIGFGGMGAVYLAERIDNKFDQKVAIKMLRQEFNTKKIRQYFRREREIQARLVHPSIAALIDAGTTEDGIPYLVMEYVDGTRIDKYCTENFLNLDQRLKIFNKVCEAVSFAHQNLVIHRDLKPSNIFITKRGEPKLLDFGISKLIDASGKKAGVFTQMGAMTPEYASPEQFKGETITTATDIYSLGVVLFKILTGSMPYKTLENSNESIFKEITNSEPTKPSFAVKENPQSTIRSPQLKGDLDNIVLKTLRKEPDLRYRTIEQLSADIWRFIDGLPVLARPATFSYRARKFYGRNKLQVITAALILLSLIAGISVSVWQASEARRQAQIAKAESANARAEAKKTKKTLEFVEKILYFSSPYWNSTNPERKRDATIAEATDAVSKTISKELKNEPEVQAEVFYMLAKSYLGRGDYAESEKLIKESINKFNQARGTNNLRSMELKGNLGDYLYLQSKFDEAEKNYLRSTNYLRQKPDAEESTKVFFAGALNGLGLINNSKGNHKLAERYFLESLSVANKFNGANRFMIPIILSNLGNTKKTASDYDAAEKYYEQALEIINSRENKKVLEAGTTFLQIGDLRRIQKKYVKAEELIKNGRQILTSIIGERNVYILRADTILAELYFDLEKYNESKDLIEKNLSIKTEVSYSNSLHFIKMKILQGKIYTRQNKLELGEKKSREALKDAKKLFKDKNQYVASAEIALAQNLKLQGKHKEADKYYKSALKNYTETLGKDHPYTKRLKIQKNTK